MKKMMLKKQTRSLQKLFLALLGLGATANTYAVQSDDETAASDTDFQEPISIDDANTQLEGASYWGDFKKVEYLTDPYRTSKPDQWGINNAFVHAVRQRRNEVVQYFKKNNLVDELGYGGALHCMLLDLRADLSEPFEYFFGATSSFPINPSTINQIWALHHLFQSPFLGVDLAKLHSFSLKALKGSIALGKYLDANPLSDEKFYEIMQITTKDGGNTPFAEYLVDRYLKEKNGCETLSRYLDANELSDKKFYQIMQITKDGRNTPFAEYLVDRYLNGKRDVSTQAMDNVIHNSTVEKGRFGVGRLKQLSKTPHLPLSGWPKSKDVMQHISEYDGNPRIGPDLLKRVKPYWEAQRVNGIVHQPVAPNGIAHQPVVPNGIAHQPEETKDQNLGDTTVNNAAGIDKDNGQNRRHNWEDLD